MAKNLIPEIAKMLGVELGEVFKVNSLYEQMVFKFADNELLGRVDEEGSMWTPTYVVLSNLLGGDVEIIKLPWKPKKGDVYFTFKLLGDKWVVRSLWWGGFPEEYALLDKGWAYRSEEEAQAALPKVAAEIGVEYKIYKRKL